MPTERHYRVLAYEFRIEANARNLAFLHRFLAPFEGEVGHDVPVYELRREPREKRPWAVYRDGLRLLRGSIPGTIIKFVLWEVSTTAIGSDHGFLAVHAAAASWRGRGIVLPAPPDSGKSTLVAGLTRAGFAYLTDEAALIDPATGMLQPFPRSLWLERPSVDAVFGPDAAPLRWQTDRQFQVRPADLRPRAIGRPCPVRFIVAPAYEAGAETALIPMSRADAVVMLAQQAFYFERFGGRGIELLGRVVEGASCYRVRIGDLDDAVRLIKREVDSHAPAPTRSTSRRAAARVP